MIDTKHASDLMDVRSYRGPNIDSDHFIIIEKIRGRLSNLKKEKAVKRNRFNTDALNDVEVVRGF